MEEITGVQIEYIYPTIGSEKELFSVLVTSSEYPDMIYLANDVSYPGRIVVGIDDIHRFETIGTYCYDKSRLCL